MSKRRLIAILVTGLAVIVIGLAGPAAVEGQSYGAGPGVGVAGATTTAIPTSGPSRGGLVESPPVQSMQATARFLPNTGGMLDGTFALAILAGAGAIAAVGVRLVRSRRSGQQRGRG
jgi:hypothetical protein